MQRHKIAAALFASSLVGVGVVSVPASAESGPACSDITDGTALYDGSGVHARMTLAKAACKTVAYTVYVTDGTTTTTPLVTVAGTPGTTTGGLPVVFFDTAVTDPTSTDGVCIYVTTSHGKHVFDRAPDAGCVPLTNGGGAGGQGFH